MNNIENNQTLQTLSSNGFSTEISSLPNFPSLNNTELDFIDSFSNTFLYQKYLLSQHININNTTINYSKSFVGNVVSANNINVPVYYVAFERNDALVGYAIFYRKPPSYIQNHPNEDSYVMGFRDYTNYSFSLKSGVVKDVDINFNHHLGSIKIDSGIIDWENSIVNSIPGDANNNGNLSFAECYHYMTTTCESDPECYTLLNAIDLAGGIGSFSIVTACMVLSVMY